MDDGRTSLAGRTLAHYRISTAIGAGGMGEVYRATDTKLARDIALKVLPPAMAVDPDRLARFRREACVVAALNHPNVVTLYSVEESDNVHFITMELIDGQPLDRLISADGLPSDQIIEIAAAIAEALAAAHEKGIVHRDLKPANVMLTKEGRVKVLDFGLAKDIGSEPENGATIASAGYTQAGMIMGTPAYMSPEQISGRPLDHRSDIFSFGVMLHEMATGRRPFGGDSSAELISSILRDQPPSVADSRPDLPRDFSRVIRRCLEKEARHRVQTARDVSNEFRDMARASAHTTPVSIASGRALVSTPGSGAARAEEGFWVAVLPFKYAGSNQDLKALAEGLTDEIVTGLSRFSYLRVIARGSTARYSGESGDVRAVGKELGARYVMEGSLRHAGSKLRIAVQLADATTGSQVWAESYERTFSPETLFELQDELVPRIVSTVADAHGILPHTMGESVRSQSPEQLSPYEAVLRCFSYAERLSAEEHAVARDALERAVAVSPTYAYAWALLSLIFKDEFESGFNPKPDPLERMLKAARRAVELDPSGHRGYHALALAHFYRNEIPAFRTAADRAIALNPLDGCNVAHLGSFIAYAGEWERGCGLVERALQLNPNHPGWFWFPLSMNAYRKCEYQAALGYALKINLPNFLWSHTMLAAIYGQLGQQEEAGKAVQELLKVNPQAAQVILAAWRQYDPELVNRLIEGLRKAGLEIAEAAPDSAPLSASMSARTASGESRASEGFWVAVLPFKCSGSSPDLKPLAEGLTDEIITGLSRFSYLRVIAHGSTAKYSSAAEDVRSIGKEVGARYVIEGNLRQAGAKLRLTIQLADTVTSTHLWAETYERTFNPDSVFDLQDDLVPRIVATIADQYGVLPRSISELLRTESDHALTPHHAVLRTFSYFTRLTSEEHAVIRGMLERAVHTWPEHADSWAMLSMVYRGEFAQGFNPRPDSLERALAAAQRAVDLAPMHALGHYALATAHFFRKEMIPFQVEAERALTLNPLDASVQAYLGLLIAAAGEWERGCELVESAMQLNPNCPGYFYFARACNAYRQGKYEEVLEAVARINMPKYFHVPALRAAALGQLRRQEEARKATQELLLLRPDLGAVAREEYSKWYSPELIEQIIEGLRKAGLEILENQRPPKADSAAG